MKNVLLVVLVISLNLFAQAKNDDPVIATVNGKNITRSELYQYHDNNLKFVKAQKKVTLESSLQDLINRSIGINKALENKIDKMPHVRKKMDDILYHAQISKDLEPKLLKIKVSDDEVNKYYAQNPEYRTAQILLRLRSNPSEAEVKETFESSLNIYKAITDGSDSEQNEKFQKAVYKYSQTNNAITGGDLGYQPKTKLTPEFYAEIKGKKKGTITKPFRSQYGYHIVQVLGVKTAEQIDKNMYKKIIYDIKRDEIVEAYFVDLRKKSKIKINKELLK